MFNINCNILFTLCGFHVRHVTPDGTFMKPIGVTTGKVSVTVTMKLNTVESSLPVTSKLKYSHVEILVIKYVINIRDNNDH